MSEDLTALSATALVAHYASRSLSPVDVTRAVVARVEALDRLFNTFVVFDADRALDAARASEARWSASRPAGPLDGVPVSVKDLILARDWPTLRGSLTTDPTAPWTDDGPPVARLRDSGAVLLGKTTTSEFGWKGVTDSALTGVTRNPWDARLTPGGSSGGAGAACALRFGPLHLATDGGGSIRIPAAFCGVFGFKPTWGLVPVHPHSPAGTLWHQGPITRHVADAAAMLDVIARPDPRDWAQIPCGVDFSAASLDAGIAGLRIAWSPDLGYARVEPDVLAATTAALDVLRDAGACIETVSLGLDDPIDVMQPLWSVALATALAPLDPARRNRVEPALQALAAPGFTLSALELRAVEKARERFGQRMQALHAQFDLLVTPQMPITAFEVGHEVPPGSGRTRWWEWSPFTYPFNLTQQPTATVPCGFDRRGLPVALQLVGAKFDDARVLRAARAFEQRRPFAVPDVDVGAASAAAAGSVAATRTPNPPVAARA
ncbi:MAG: amidase [Burkholderiales bacterium]|nr:amidase [Burkholderiales bacterium]